MNNKFDIISSRSYYNIKKHSPVYKNFKNFIKDKKKHKKGFMNITLKKFSKLRKYKSQRNYSKNKKFYNLKIKVPKNKEINNKYTIKNSISSKSSNKLYLKNKENWNQFDKILNKVPLIIKTESGIKKKNLLLKKLKPKKHFKIHVRKKESVIKAQKNYLKTLDNFHFKNFNNYFKNKRQKTLFINSNIDNKILKNNNKNRKNLLNNNTYRNNKNLLNDSCMDFSESNYNKFCINHPQYKLFDTPKQKLEEKNKEEKKKKKKIRSKKTNLFFFDTKKRIPIKMITKIKVKTRKKRLNLQKIKVYNHKFQKFKEILEKISLVKPNKHKYLIKETSLENNNKIEKKNFSSSQKTLEKQESEVIIIPTNLNMKYFIEKNLTFWGKDIKKCIGIIDKGHFLNLEPPYTYINSVSYNSYWMDNIRYCLETDNLYDDVREDVNGYFQLFFEGDRKEKFENYVNELVDSFYFKRKSNYNLVCFFNKIKLDLMTNHKFFSKTK